MHEVSEIIEDSWVIGTLGIIRPRPRNTDSQSTALVRMVRDFLELHFLLSSNLLAHLPTLNIFLQQQQQLDRIQISFLTLVYEKDIFFLKKSLWKGKETPQMLLLCFFLFLWQYGRLPTLQDQIELVSVVFPLLGMAS